MDADIVLLQEMNEAGAARVAEALGMCWVYYPAVVHPKAHGNFGNAILAHQPLLAPEKIILPHLGGIGRTQRIATAATIMLGDRPLRLYSVHVGTWAELTREQRKDQVAAVIDAADAFDGDVIIGGDLNDEGLCASFEAAGYNWLTRKVGRTCKLWSLDHVFTRGLVAGGSCGRIPDNRGASDHFPVWVTLGVPATSPRVAVGSRINW